MMGALIQTRGTGYLCSFYNREFEANWAFHQASAALYNRAGAPWNVWDNLMTSIVDTTRGILPLYPTPDASQPHLVARWRLFFKGPGGAAPPIFSVANQGTLIDSIYNVLNNSASESIQFGVRPGAAQGVDFFPLPGTGTRYMINIVVDHASQIPAGGPPPLDPQP
jgi:hypothetical protein